MNLLDRIDKWIAPPLFIIAVAIAMMICSGGTMPVAHADQGCNGSCADAPRLGDFTVPGSNVFGFEPDHGRTTFTFYWNGSQSAIVQIGRVVQGQWTPYLVDVGRNSTVKQQQSLALLVGGKPELVSMTTSDMKPGDRIEARAWWTGKFFLSLSRDDYYPLASANWGDLRPSLR